MDARAADAEQPRKSSDHPGHDHDVLTGNGSHVRETRRPERLPKLVVETVVVTQNEAPEKRQPFSTDPVLE